MRQALDGLELSMFGRWKRQGGELQSWLLSIFITPLPLPLFCRSLSRSDDVDVNIRSFLSSIKSISISHRTEPVYFAEYYQVLYELL